MTISRIKTPKLNTSDFTEKTPSNANSGAMYPLHASHAFAAQLGEKSNTYKHRQNVRHFRLRSV